MSMIRQNNDNISTITGDSCAMTGNVLFFFLQHTVVEVDLGEKKYERSKSSNTEFTKYAMDNVRNVSYLVS